MDTIKRIWKGLKKHIIVAMLICMTLAVAVSGYIILSDNPFIGNTYSTIKTLSDGRIVFPPSIGAGDTIDYLRALQVERNYHIIVNSFGGSAYDAIAVMNRIAELQRKGFIITTEIYGYALSGGAFIFIMGDTRIIHDGATIMFHGVGFSGVFGVRQSLRSFILTGKTDLDPYTLQAFVIIDNKLAKELKERTNMTDEEIKHWLYALDYNHMTADEAVKLKVATELR